VVSKVRTASRTDIGVHALCNAFTFDTVQDAEARKEYDCESFRKGLNHYMITNEEQIQINEVRQTLDPWFDCRASPISRTYLYKMILV
jgi:tRNA U38,U39,U40 pseudouridine synthase TruA